MFDDDQENIGPGVGCRSGGRAGGNKAKAGKKPDSWELRPATRLHEVGPPRGMLSAWSPTRKVGIVVAF